MTIPTIDLPDATIKAMLLFKSQEILQATRRHFNLDFEVSDIPTTDMHAVFTQSECDDINRHATEEGRIDQLFYFLSLDVSKFRKFIEETIVDRYAWLSNQMRSAFRDTANDTFLREKFEKMRALRIDMPRLADYNVHRKEYVSFFCF